MTSPIDEWNLLCDAFSRFEGHLNQTKAVNINTISLRNEAKILCQQYFRQFLPVIQQYGLDAITEDISNSFKEIFSLSGRIGAKSTYKKHMKLIKKTIPKISTHLEISNVSKVTPSIESTEDSRIVDTLENLVPSASLSYKQAIRDLADDSRVSFRGPALELRESLREVLDHLAPDKEVEGADGYVREKDRAGPTMKQKVRFILKSRGLSKSNYDVPERTAATLEEMIAVLTRAIYERSSVATHLSQERKTVEQIRRYVAAILCQILEI